MRNDALSVQSMDFAVSIINLVKELKEKHETVISNQIGRSGTSIGANIREAQYAHGKADFIAKLQIALKEANETSYWLELLYRTSYIDEQVFKELDVSCSSLRVMLISSINTAKANQTNPYSKKPPPPAVFFCNKLFPPQLIICRSFIRIAFSLRETCTCDMPSCPATTVCVSPL